MKILQINKFFYRKGGSEAYFFDLSKILEDHGHEVMHFSVKNSENEKSPYDKFFLNEINFEKREGLWKDIKKIGHSLYSLEAKKKLEKLILETKPDIAHLHNISHHISPSIFSVFKKYKIPAVQTLHDYQLICPNYKLLTQGKVCERCKKRKYWNAVIYKCIHNSRIQSLAECFEMYFHKIFRFYENGVDYFITPSKFLKERIEEWGAVPTTKIFNIPNFIDVRKYEPRYEPGDYALYFGRISEEKGVDVLLDAVSGTDIKLKIIGEGPLLDNLKSEISNLKSKKVEFLGYKNGKELHEIIRGAKFVVLPSIWYENYPISLIEAGALGKPAIGSNIGGIPEIIKDGVNGFLAKPSDANDLKNKMNLLWTNDEICEKMGRTARKMVEENNEPERHYVEMMKVYEKLISSR
jgi:glycosyltransferase involved in cell wall biosynthesis